MSNKFDSQILDDFYKYCDENPKAKEAVNTVIQAFSPNSIGEFIKNCKQVPLPTDADSYGAFCLEYDKQLQKVQEAPKKETVVEKDKVVVVENNDKKQEISKERQTVLDTLTT